MERTNFFNFLAPASSAFRIDECCTSQKGSEFSTVQICHVRSQRYCGQRETVSYQLLVYVPSKRIDQRSMLEILVLLVPASTGFIKADLCTPYVGSVVLAV
jgi:hypothetical protein